MLYIDGSTFNYINVVNIYTCLYSGSGQKILCCRICEGCTRRRPKPFCRKPFILPNCLMDLVIKFYCFFPLLLGPQGLSDVRRSVFCKMLEIPLLAVKGPGSSPECRQVKSLRPPRKLLCHSYLPPLAACQIVSHVITCRQDLDVPVSTWYTPKIRFRSASDRTSL